MENRILSDIPPFRLHRGIWFAGSSKVSVHIIATEQGLVMLDTGYPDMYEQILSSMACLGLDPKDICAIFLTHGHIDHFGCVREFQALSGAKTYISRIDQQILRGEKDLSWAHELGYPRLPPFSCDVSLEDGDCFSFGSTRIRCVLTPGHTDGTMSFFISSGEGPERITAAMHGGTGFNSMKTQYLKRYGLSLACREAFLEGLRKVSNEPVDLVLGNHPGQNDTKGKLAQVQAGAETVLDPTEWRRFLLRTEADFLAYFQAEANATTSHGI